MNRPYLTNKELDEIGKGLFKAARAELSDAEQVISDPILYEKVLRRILHDDRARRPAGRIRFRTAAACATLIAVAAGVYLFRPVERDVADAGISVSRSFQSNEGVPPAIDEEPNSFGPGLENVAGSPKNTVQAPRQSSRRREIARQPAVPAVEFHAIGFPAGIEEAAFDGRVVRVELPRSALFAMGANVPLENGTNMMTAEILVGADGSPRAIRLVE